MDLSLTTIHLNFFLELNITVSKYSNDGRQQLKHLPFPMYLSWIETPTIWHVSILEKPDWFFSNSLTFPDFLTNFRKIFFLPWLPWLRHSWLLATLNNDIKNIIIYYFVLFALTGEHYVQVHMQYVHAQCLKFKRFAYV